MEEQRLITYLKDICELEKEKRITENTMSVLSQKYQTSKNIYQKYKAWKPYTVTKPSVSKTSLAVCIIMLLIAIMVFLAGVSSNVKGSMSGFLFYVLLSFIAGCFYIRNLSRAETKYQEEAKSAAKKNQENAAKATALITHNETAMEIFNQNFRILKDAQNNIDKTLSEMYELNIIHPKYRYLEACGMFLEYFEAGRTHSLGVNGADRGAYNIFEDELYHKIIVNRLDQILQNQQILIAYQQKILRTMNEIVAGIDNACERIGQNLDQVHGTLKQIHSTEKSIEFYNSVVAYNSMLSKKYH